ncbi:hypothetical protein KJ903_05735 [Patescibacteria group bacterium]|nr:hypothetical protein [Patescibacteria group bacterium]
MTKPKHLVFSKDIDKAGYEEIVMRADKFLTEGIPADLMKRKVAATLFFQPSTRTMTSAQVAMLRSGGGFVSVTGEQGLSMEKGESLEDTVRTFSGMSDIIVIRHTDEDSAERAAKVSRVPVINGGSGSKEHAVGAAMMMVNIFHYLKRLEGLKVGIYGTPEINRCIKAIVPIMGHFGVEVYVDDFGEFPIPKEVEEQAKKNGLKKLEYGKLDDFIGEVDYLLVTRGLQKGIIPDDMFPKEKEEMIMKKYKPITTEHMKKLRPDAFLDMLTPLIFEIERDVDPDPRAIYSKKELFVESMLAAMSYLMGVEV